MEVEYLHLCDYACTTQGNKPCLIGIFEFLRAANFPYTHPAMSMGVLFHGIPNEVAEVRVEILRPNHDVLSVQAFTVPIGPNGGTFASILFLGTVFPEAGQYTARITSGGVELASQTLPVQPAQAGGPALPPAVVVH